jgi:type IV fimbrial biogenesis protein FimT
MQNANSRRSQAGLTLVESMIALSVTATLVGTAVPSFQQFLQRRQLEGVATQVAADIMHVRSEAVARNVPVRISFKPAAGGSCYVVHTGSANECSCDGTGPAVCTGDARELKTVYWPHSSRVRVQANVGSMLFDPVHATTVPASTVRVLADNGQAVHQVVNVMGRPRACSPGGAVRGYTPC